jgi:hypothetical protein
MKVFATVVLILIILCAVGYVQVSGYKIAAFYCTELAIGKHGGLLCVN